MTLQKMVDGVAVDMSPEEEAATLAEWAANDEAAAAYVAPKTPTLYAVAQLAVSDGNITGIDVASRFSAALWFDVGLYYIFFTETQPDTSYLAKAYDDVTRVRVTEKGQDYLVVTATDDAGNPVDPAEFAVEIIRIT